MKGEKEEDSEGKDIGARQQCQEEVLKGPLLLIAQTSPVFCEDGNAQLPSKMCTACMYLAWQIFPSIFLRNRYI